MPLNLIHRLTWGFRDWRNANWRDHRDTVIHRTDPVTAWMMPNLGLPRMKGPARKAFRAMVAHEGNVSADVLRLVEARGFTVHPSDWLPRMDYANHFPARYQPWVSWLARWYYAPWGEAIVLTPANARRFGTETLCKVFRTLYRRDRAAAYEFLLTWGRQQGPAVRLTLLQGIGGGANFTGHYPSDLPILKAFAEDPDEKVRAFARDALRKMAGFESAEAHAEHIAFHLDVHRDHIALAGPWVSLMRHFHCTTPEALAAALDLTPSEMVRLWPEDLFEGDLWYMITHNGGPEVRTAYAEKRLAEGKGAEADLLRDLSPELQERGLRATFTSVYSFSVNNFLGSRLGTLDAAQMEAHDCYIYLPGSVRREIETGKLPVNIRYDALRVLGLALDKPAAQRVLDEVLALGMAPNNPRLTMLRLNLAL